MPGVPGIPQAYAQQNGSNGEPARQERSLDKRALQDPNLQPEQCRKPHV